MTYARRLGVGASLLLVVSSVFVGCDDGTGTDGGTATTGSSTGTSSGATVTLSVASYDRVKKINSFDAGAGKVFLTVDLEISNGTAKPIQLLPPAYAVESDAGVRYAGTSEGELLSGSCDSTASLAAGGSTHCVFAFKVPLETLTTKLVYTDAATGGTEYQTDFTIEPCSVCNDGCIAAGTMCCAPGIDLESDTMNCGTCGRACAIPGTQEFKKECVQGSCSFSFFSTTVKTCAELCASGGFTCSTTKQSFVFCGMSYPVGCNEISSPMCTNPETIGCECEG